MGKNINSLIAKQQLQQQQLQQQQQLELNLAAAKNNNANNSNKSNGEGTSSMLYYAIGAAAFILIAVLVYFFVFRKKSSTTSSSSPPATVVVEPKKDTPAAAKKETGAKKEKDSPAEEMFPESTSSSSLRQDYQIFKSVANTKKALGLSDKKDKVTTKDYQTTKYLDAIGIIDGKLRINDTCIKKDKDNDFKLVKCTDVLGTPAIYDETTKMLKNGTRCLSYNDKDGLKMDTKCTASDTKYQWTKDVLPKA
jgi:hypothetical protein